MQPYFDDGNGIQIYHADNLAVLPTLAGIHACVTDPPYGLDEKHCEIAATRLQRTQRPLAA